jgi:hypothetical protein
VPVRLGIVVKKGIEKRLPNGWEIDLSSTSVTPRRKHAMENLLRNRFAALHSYRQINDALR